MNKSEVKTSGKKSTIPLLIILFQIFTFIILGGLFFFVQNNNSKSETENNKQDPESSVQDGESIYTGVQPSLEEVKQNMDDLVSYRIKVESTDEDYEDITYFDVINPDRQRVIGELENDSTTELIIIEDQVFSRFRDDGEWYEIESTEFGIAFEISGMIINQDFNFEAAGQEGEFWVFKGKYEDDLFTVFVDINTNLLNKIEHGEGSYTADFYDFNIDIVIEKPEISQEALTLQQNARNTARKSDLQLIELLLEEYYASYIEYPETLYFQTDEKGTKAVIDEAFIYINFGDTTGFNIGSCEGFPSGKEEENEDGFSGCYEVTNYTQSYKLIVEMEGSEENFEIDTTEY